MTSATRTTVTVAGGTVTMVTDGHATVTSPQVPQVNCRAPLASDADAPRDRCDRCDHLPPTSLHCADNPAALRIDARHRDLIPVRGRDKLHEPDGEHGMPLQVQGVLHLGAEPERSLQAFSKFGIVLRHELEEVRR